MAILRCCSHRRTCLVRFDGARFGDPTMPGTRARTTVSACKRSGVGAGAACHSASASRCGRVVTTLACPALAAGMAAVVLLIVAVLIATNVGAIRDRLPGASAGGPSVQALAVLPLDNLSGDPGQDYFADGMTESLISSLAPIRALVISRTSAMRYKGTTKSLPEIARELNVDAVLEGSVQHANGRVRVTAQLDPRSERHAFVGT